MSALTRLFVSLLVLFTPILLFANRTVCGSVSFDGINLPDMAAVRVSVYDADGDTDDLMGQAYLEELKVFSIQYENKKWDPFPMDFITWWRPDIYLMVEIYEEDQWIPVYRSETYEDWKTSNDLEVHLYVEFNEPLTADTYFRPEVHGFNFHTQYLEKQSDGQLTGDLSGGVCFSTLDVYYNHQPPFFFSAEDFIGYFAQRQNAAEKDGSIAERAVDWIAKPNRARWNKKDHLGYLTQQELEQIRNKIDAKKPAVIVLLPEIFPEQDARFPPTCQVIAYRYEFDQTRQITRLWVYDPTLVNPGEAILTILHGFTDGHVQIGYNQPTHHGFQGLFLNPYDKREVRKAFAMRAPKPGPILF